jgi:capsular polysaccharide transport system permease protein
MTAENNGEAAAGLAAPAQPSGSWRMARTVTALALREMATSYGRSPGGYLWAILQPTLALTVLTLAFSIVLRSPSLGSSFPLFYASGYLPFMLFNDVSNTMARSVKFSRPLLGYPAVTFVDALIARFLLTTMTHLVIGSLILTGILAFMDSHALLDIPRILEGVALAALFGAATGVLNCYLMSAMPLWETAWSIATRPLFLMSGVFFIYEDLPAFGREFLWWNPLIHVTGITRTGIYSTYEADYSSAVYVLAVSGIAGVLGLMLLYRFNRDLMER